MDSFSVLFNVETLLLLIAMGALSGVLAGLLGIGGGLIIVPVLALLLPLLGIPESVLMHVALASSMATISFTAISSARSHHKRGSVSKVATQKLLVGVMIGSLGGTFIAQILDTLWLTVVFSAFSIVMGLLLLRKKAEPVDLEAADATPLTQPTGSAVAMGAVSSLVGIGGGSLVVPYLLHHEYATVRAIGSAAWLGVPLAIMATVGYMVLGMANPVMETIYFSTGYVFWPVVIVLALGAMTTAPIGAFLAHKLPALLVRRIFAVLLIAVAIKLLVKLL